MLCLLATWKTFLEAKLFLR